MTKKALITGITGQDGSYLAEFLLEKGYIVYGMQHTNGKTCNPNIQAIQNQLHFVSGDLTDAYSLDEIIETVKPDEIYNLAAKSDVKESERNPLLIWEINAYGTARLLQSIKRHIPTARFYQASTAEMFGNAPPPQNENTPFIPRNPYGASKCWAHQQAHSYREQGIFTTCGILFNHESPRRGHHFVTRKITRGLVRIKKGIQEKLELGNLETRRDWGYAGDYVKTMWLMLQQEKPNDYVIATGEAHTVRAFVETAARFLNMCILWQGTGEKETGIWNNKEIISINPEFFRKQERNYLLGDSGKARTDLRWKPELSFDDLITLMVQSDLADFKT